MPENFADRLLAAISAKGSSVIVGIDPVYDRLPTAIREHKELNDAGDSEIALDAIFEFCRHVLKAVAPHVPAVKINSAFFERYLWGGLESYFALVQEAAALDLLVIGDVKRGDVAHSAECYAAAHLADPEFTNLDEYVGPDAVTVSAYLGQDSVQPFTKVGVEESKGVFALVRTTNPGASAIQDFEGADGVPFHEHLAKQVARWAEEDALMGTRGYSLLGAVVAADEPAKMERMRLLLPQSLLLIPGYGVQGADPKAIAAGFKSAGTGAVVSASRSVIFAYEEARYAEEFPGDWEKCVEQATIDMKTSVQTLIGGGG